jgi:hypothetical protein
MVEEENEENNNIELHPITSAKFIQKIENGVYVAEYLSPRIRILIAISGENAMFRIEKREYEFVLRLSSGNVEKELKSPSCYLYEKILKGRKIREEIGNCSHLKKEAEDLVIALLHYLRLK